MAEGDGLENRCVSNGTGGSNPSPSALVCVATLCCAMSRHFFVHLVVVDGVVLNPALSQFLVHLFDFGASR